MRKFLNKQLYKKLNLQIDVMIYHSLDDINDDILRNCLKKPFINPYELNCFWKTHFIETMNPQHLPAYWSAHYGPLQENYDRQ
jgi:hypothetical protein